MVATKATNELGKTEVTASIDLWIPEKLGTETTQKFSDVKIEIPGRGTWSDLSATERESGKAFRLTIQIPDGAKVPTAIAQGKTVVVTVGDKSFTADLSGSVVAINDISKCLG